MSEMERLLAEAKKELSIDAKRLNVKMLAISNGYSVASHLLTHTTPSGDAEDIAHSFVKIADIISAGIAKGYLKAIDEAEGPNENT